MAVETNIIFEFKGIPLIIPETVNVKVHTIVRFIVRLYPNFKQKYFQQLNLSSVELYFDSGVPFRSKELNSTNGIYTARINQDLVERSLDEPTDITIVEGVVDIYGEFKYGVRATSLEGEELFDEDPYLIVLPPRYYNGFFN